MYRLSFTLAMLVTVNACNLWPSRGEEIPVPVAEVNGVAGHMMAQRIVVHSADRVRVIETLLEWSSERMTLAGMSLGVRLGTVRWEQSRLRVHGRFAEFGGIDADGLARDLLYALLPADHLVRNLHYPWHLDDAGTRRVLYHGGVLVLSIEYLGGEPRTATMVIDNPREGYRLSIETVPI